FASRIHNRSCGSFWTSEESSSVARYSETSGNDIFSHSDRSRPIFAYSAFLVSPACSKSFSASAYNGPARYQLYSHASRSALSINRLGLLSVGRVWAASGAHNSAAATAIGMAVRTARPMKRSYPEIALERWDVEEDILDAK